MKTTNIVNHDLYAYSDKLHLNAGRMKLGDSTLSETLTRIDQQVTAATSDTLVRYGNWSIGSNRDFAVRKILEKYGFPTVTKKGRVVDAKDLNKKRRSQKTEWVDFGTSDVNTILFHISRAVNELLHGVSRPWTFKMRNEQVSFVECGNAYFKKVSSEPKIFLLNGKMRFGKTHAAYQLMKRLNSRITLVLTYKPGVRVEWKNNLDNHVDFVEFKFLDALEFKGNEKFDAKDKIVIFASFQDILGKGLNGSPKKKWLKILAWLFNNVELLIIDEAHYGADKQKAMDFTKQFKCKYRIDMSGTPLRLLSSGIYEEENTYSWTFIDEQLIKREDINKTGKESEYYWLPNLKFFRYTLGEKVIKDSNAYTDEEQFKLNKFFAASGESDDAKFIHPASVEKFVDNLAETDSKIYASPFNDNELAGKLNHLFWMLDSVNSVYAMKSLLSKHNFFKKYRIVVACADNDGEGADTKSIVENAIKNNDRTITLSCGKLNTGVTISEWSGVFCLTDTVSPETYWQTVFRVQSEDKKNGKLCGYIFDWNPNRMLQMIYAYCDTVAKKNQSTQAVVRKFLDVTKILSYQDNKLVMISDEELQGAIISTINVAKSLNDITSERMLMIGNIDIEAVEILEHVVAESKTKSGESIELAKSLLKNGKTFASSINKGKKVKKDADKFLDMQKLKVIAVLKFIPEFIRVLNPKVKFESVHELTNTVHGDLFKEATGIGMDGFKILIEKKIIREDRLERTIQSLNFTLK